jgi:hypothetical protein
MNDLLKENRVEGIEGTIIGFRGSRDSRIAHLVVDEVHVPCLNGSTVRCLNSHFPNFIIEGHGYDENAIIGKRIEYTVDDFGVLETLTPVASGANEVH